ncbi:MAG: hypothetical protein RLZZ385_1800 [Pseudomonadota bacterium]|jgi:uncharacterized membrane-anchored protein YhcB (DUF1043 family)
MTWLIAAGCLALGVVIGVAFASRFNASPSRVRDLESQIQKLQQDHNRYRDDVSEHFSTTAELVHQMTESYRDVYQHLATGAQELCSGEVANKLLPASTDTVFDMPSVDEVAFAPPKDYAAKQNPQQKGALAEDFGLDKSKSHGRDEQSF